MNEKNSEKSGKQAHKGFKPHKMTWKTVVVLCLITLPLWYVISWKIVRGPWNALNRADEFLSQGRYKESLKEYEKAIASNKGLVSARTGKGLSLLYLGRFEEALDSFDRALSLKPKNVLAWKGKGLSYEKLIRYDEAVQCYEKGLELSPENNGLKRLKDNLLEQLHK